MTTTKTELTRLMLEPRSRVEQLEAWGSISQSTASAYYAVWNWSAPRHSGLIGMKHDAFWDKYGKDAYYARINKVRKAFGFKTI